MVQMSEGGGERAERSGMGAREAAERAKRGGETEQSPPSWQERHHRTRTEQVNLLKRPGTDWEGVFVGGRGLGDGQAVWSPGFDDEQPAAAREPRDRAGGLSAGKTRHVGSDDL